MSTSISVIDTPPPRMKRSRAKLWIRTGILAVFGTLFGIALSRDIIAGVFPVSWGLAVFCPIFVVGFFIRSLVPMTVHLASKTITFSFDRIYFGIILVLVAAKAITGHLDGMTFHTDALMCVILGLMIGRLSGICLRVPAPHSRGDVDGEEGRLAAARCARTPSR